uniref:Uncharacterized protein n=1 Tax=Arundo donax TaxID=35708 RepID=A0A0A9FFG4_ARUDO
MDMVSTLSLHRIETRSMYGLVSFLCTRYHHLDFHRAICCLLEADANLLRADPNLGPTGQRKYWATYTIFDAPGLNIISRSDRGDSPWNTTTGFPIGLCSVDALARGPDTSVNEAFKAAAAAAHHPNPDAQANLFASPKALMVLAADQLSSEAVQRIARFLCPEHPYSEQPLPPFPLKEYVSAHTKISKKVNAVLNAYEQMPNGEPKYQLHVICGVNYLVSGPVYCPGGSTFAPHKCYHSHVNFLATSRDTQSQAGEAKVVLFFAELSNDDEDKAGAQSLCCPVWLPPPCAERIRCLYCDYVGARIVHPIQEEFHGRKREFEKMVCGEDPCDDMVCGEDPYVFDPVRIQTYYTNMDAIRHSCLIADEVGCLKEDCLYADSYGLEGHKSDEDGRVIDYMIDEYDVFE